MDSCNDSIKQYILNSTETYRGDHSEAEFSSGLCPDCAETISEKIVNWQNNDFDKFVADKKTGLRHLESIRKIRPRKTLPVISNPYRVRSHFRRSLMLQHKLSPSRN